MQVSHNFKAALDYSSPYRSIYFWCHDTTLKNIFSIEKLKLTWNKQINFGNPPPLPPPPPLKLYPHLPGGGEIPRRKSEPLQNISQRSLSRSTIYSKSFVTFPSKTSMKKTFSLKLWVKRDSRISCADCLTKTILHWTHNVSSLFTCLLTWNSVGTWKLYFISLLFWYKLLVSLWKILSNLITKHVL